MSDSTANQKNTSEKYPCKECKNTLEMNLFSKTQINRLQHNKITTAQLICKSCVSMLESVELEKAAKKQAQKDINIQQQNELRLEKQYLQIENEKKKKLKLELKLKNANSLTHEMFNGYNYTKDPSLEYIRNPTNIPLIKEAKNYIFSLNHQLKLEKDKRLEYQVHTNSPTSGWRSVVKLAVRQNPSYKSYLSKKTKNSKHWEHNRRILIGLFQTNSHIVNPTINHPSHHPNINRVIESIDEILNDPNILNVTSNDAKSLTSERFTLNDVTAYEESTSSNIESIHHASGLLKYILLNIENHSNKVQLTLVWNTDITFDETEVKSEKILNFFIQQIVAKCNSNKICNNVDDDIDGSDSEPSSVSIIHSIWVNYNHCPAHINRITEYDPNHWKLCYPQQMHVVLSENNSADGDIHMDTRNNDNSTNNKNLIHYHLNSILSEKCMLLTEKCLSPAPKMELWFLPTLYLPPFVFRQANLTAFQHIIVKIRQYIANYRMTFPKNTSMRNTHDSENSDGIHLLELYGGVGTIGLHCLDLLKGTSGKQQKTNMDWSYSCSDENPYNKLCFESSIAQIMKQIKAMNTLKQENNGDSKLIGVDVLPTDTEFRSNIKYASLSANDMCSRNHHIDKVRFSSQACGLLGYDILLVDPPRKGLDYDVLKTLITLNPIVQGNPSTQSPNRIIYISCGFKAFKRDSDILQHLSPITTYNNHNKTEMKAKPFDVTSKWKLIHSEGHLLFPGSNHVETVAIFDRVV